MIYSRIVGSGSYLPTKIMTNEDWSQLVDTNHDWIVSRTGISERRIASDTDTTVSMGTHAAQQALDAAGLSPDDIDLIIVGTCTPDQFFPSSACLIQAKLGIQKTVIAFDVSAACAGFMVALATADNYVRAGQVKHALVIGSEVMSRTLDWTDRNTCVLFGDGAGALVLSASDTPGILSTNLHAQGQYQSFLNYPNAQIAAEDHKDERYLSMRGQDVYKLAVRAMAEVVDEALTDAGIDKQSIDWLVPHQANLRIISSTAKKCGMSMDRVVVTVNKHGNTSSASVPLALDEAIRDGRIKSGDLVMLEGIGGGMVWGGALVKM